MPGEANLDDLFSVKGKTALVTGGSGGIGFMIASGLVKAGASVTIAARNQDKLDDAAARLSEYGDCVGVQADVGSPEGVDALAGALNEHLDRLDILVNNAGATWGKPLEKFPDDAWGALNAINVQGPFMLIQRLLPLLQAAADRDAPASVINIGSIYGFQTDVLTAYSYAATKAAIHHLSRVLARDLTPRKIHVNAIAPGLFPSNMTQFMLENEAVMEQVVSHIPAGRPGAPDDVAGMVIFLASRAGAYVAGAVIPLDGGALIAH
ncbi:MAG: SDR family oxidoreductase [Xanthomonadales bacterium]|nr:SDR family oxidoreductase [Xanthomonadales bacterium]